MKGGPMDQSVQNDTGIKTGTKTNWLLICAGVVIAVVVAVNVFGVSMSNVVYFGAILACPLLHILMMRRGDHKH